MRTVLITGAKGFIGRNLAVYLRPRQDVQLVQYDLGNTEAELRAWASQANVVFHLAGVNRPRDVQEFETGNAGFTETLCGTLAGPGRRPHVIFSSSIQAQLDNPYGTSKRRAEEALQRFAAQDRRRVSIFRLKNVFGKWCRPDYNSVVATFCHNVAHDLPIQVHDPNRVLELVHVDDVVAAFIEEMDNPQARDGVFVDPDPIPSYTLPLGDLVGRLQAFRQMQESSTTPDYSVPLNRKLYATYLSCVDPARWEYGLDVQRRRAGQSGRVHQVALVRPGLPLAHPPGHHPGQPLPPREDREVPGHCRGRADPVPARGGDRRPPVPGSGRGLPGGRNPARLYPFDHERGHDGDDHPVLGQRGLRPGPAGHVVHARRSPDPWCKPMKVATIVGTRPEIIRLSRVMAALDRHVEHVLVHTGQNYDYELNQIFFDDLEIRKPDHFLDAAGADRRRDDRH